VLASLYQQLRGRHCEVTPSDLRVAIGALGIYTYPDVTVVCGEPQFEDAEQDTLLNPTLLVEILSPLTESCDRGKKFQRYRLIPTFREYLLIAQDQPLIEHYPRQTDNRWLLATFEQPGDVIALDSIGCTLALADVYAGIRFDQPAR
jgi:Uma2 family endonuclease